VMRRHLNAGYDGTGAASFSAFAARGAGVRKLLERESELAAVRSGVGRGRLLVVEGGVGLGKTAILDAASAAARRSGRLVLGARGSELERDFAFGVVRQLFEGIAPAHPMTSERPCSGGRLDPRQVSRRRDGASRVAE